MKLHRTAPLLVAALLCGATQDSPDHPGKLSYPALRFDVPDPAAMRMTGANGLTIYAIEDSSLPLVNVDVLIRAGSFWEPKDRAGLASVCGTLMRIGGTASRAPQDLDEQLETIAAELSVSIGETQGQASLSVLSKDLDTGLELLFDVLRNPAFRQEKLDLLKEQVLQGLKARNDRTNAIENRELNLHLYGEHPINRHATKASVESMTREDLIAFHREFFAPASFIVAVTGDFKKAGIAAKLAKFTAGWSSPGTQAPSVPPLAGKAEPSVLCFHKEGKNINQGRVSIAHRGIDIHDPDLHALRIMSYILGQGSFSSRLTQRVRTAEGLVYDVDGSMAPGIRYPGLFRMSFQSKSESCLFAAKLCIEELEKMRTAEVSPKELQDAIAFYVDGFPRFFFETKQRTAFSFANAEMNGYPGGYFQTYREKLAKVTAADVMRVARDRCRPEQLSFIFVGNMEAIAAGDGKHPIKLGDFGPVKHLPLPDPFTLERPKQ